MTQLSQSRQFRLDISGLELWLPLISGAKVVLASRETAVDGIALRALMERTCEQHRDAKVMLQATPATFRLLVEAGWKGGENVVVLCGGEAWPAGLSAQLRARSNAVWNVYGPTETTIWSTRALVTTDEIVLGEPLANTTLYVLDAGGELSPIGVPGELWIGGAGVARGYHGRADLTAERFVHHAQFGLLYRTGDLVRRTADGRLTYLRRQDDQVKVRGYRIELGEIEAVVATMPEVVQVAVSLQRTTPDADPRIMCHVVLTETGKTMEAMLLPGITCATARYAARLHGAIRHHAPGSPSAHAERKSLTVARCHSSKLRSQPWRANSSHRVRRSKYKSLTPGAPF